LTSGFRRLSVAFCGIPVDFGSRRNYNSLHDRHTCAEAVLDPHEHTHIHATG
jgi:hypothetical protein